LSNVDGEGRKRRFTVERKKEKKKQRKGRKGEKELTPDAMDNQPSNGRERKKKGNTKGNRLATTGLGGKKR